MKVAVVHETDPLERRVALIPAAIASLTKVGWEVVVETGAGESAGFSDADYQNKGAQIVDDRPAAFQAADVIVQVRALGANLEAGRGDLELFRAG